MTDSIRTRPATQEYRDGWERTFGKPRTTWSMDDGVKPVRCHKPGCEELVHNPDYNLCDAHVGCLEGIPGARIVGMDEIAESMIEEAKRG